MKVFAFVLTSMLSFRFWQLLGICLIAQAMPLLAGAQQSKNAPPKLEKLEEGDAPAAAPKPSASDKTTITEKRGPGGKRTETKITSGNSTYYVKPYEPGGTTQPGDAQSSANRPAQWQVFTFGGSQPKPQGQSGAGPSAPLPPTLSNPDKK
ncbi:MAG: hypothetical protein HYS18_09775 [Burkholderiales bacterium]|nr:hypothetical protein [Burkholderiales bacterium]